MDVSIKCLSSGKPTYVVLTYLPVSKNNLSTALNYFQVPKTDLPEQTLSYQTGRIDAPKCVCVCVCVCGQQGPTITDVPEPLEHVLVARGQRILSAQERHDAHRPLTLLGTPELVLCLPESGHHLPTGAAHTVLL